MSYRLAASVMVMDLQILAIQKFINFFVYRIMTCRRGIAVYLIFSDNSSYSEWRL